MSPRQLLLSERPSYACQQAAGETKSNRSSCSRAPASGQHASPVPASRINRLATVPPQPSWMMSPNSSGARHSNPYTCFATSSAVNHASPHGAHTADAAWPSSWGDPANTTLADCAGALSLLWDGLRPCVLAHTQPPHAKLRSQFSSFRARAQPQRYCRSALAPPGTGCPPYSDYMRG